MTDVSSQRQLAAKILNAGRNRIWIDPEKLEQVSAALTRQDVQRLIDKGIIKKLKVEGISRGRKRARQVKKRHGRLRGAGKIRGSYHARISGKRRWINTIRPIRRYLTALKLKKLIDTRTYRHLYLQAGGGFFRNKTHLKLYLEKEGMLSGK